jgi:RNA polymerase sigma-70 factor (ECF subfamily)
MASSIQAALDDVCVRIFEADFDYVYRSLIRMGVARADAEDLAQEVFLVMWRRRADWDAGRPLRPWLFGVALRIAHDYRHRRGREAPMGTIDQTDDRPRGEEQVAAARAQALVVRAIATLPEKQRAVLILHEIEGTPMREVAETLAVPLFTAYTRLRAARKSFAKAVRRLELVRPGLAAAARDPEPLLAHERARMVPPEIRQRGVERARALAAGLPHAQTPPPVAAPRGWNWTATALGIAVLVVLAVAGVVNHRLERRHPMLASAHAPASTAPAAAPASEPAAPPQLGQGLVGYWSFDDLSGGIARDLSGNHLDCELQRFDPARASTGGVAGRAVHFEGLQHLQCARPEIVQRLQQAVTVAGWINVDRPEHDLRAILAWQRGQGRGRYGLFFGLAGSKLVLGSDVWGRIEAPLDSMVGRWVHVAATRAPDGRLRLFVDGAEAESEDGPRGPLGSGINPLTIGGHIHPGLPVKVTQRFHGAVDDLVLFDRALSGDEIALLASRQAPLSQLASRAH